MSIEGPMASEDAPDLRAMVTECTTVPTCDQISFESSTLARVGIPWD